MERAAFMACAVMLAVVGAPHVLAEAGGNATTAPATRAGNGAGGKTDRSSQADRRPADEGQASPQTGGDQRPNAVDPAEATRTGANASEGASYSRSTEAGASVVSEDDKTPGAGKAGGKP